MHIFVIASQDAVCLFVTCDFFLFLEISPDV